MDSSWKIYTGRITHVNTSFNSYIIDIIATEDEINKIGVTKFVGVPISIYSDTEEGSGFVPTYRVGDTVMMMISYFAGEEGSNLRDNSAYIIGAVSQTGRFAQFDNQLSISSGKGARVVIEDQYPTSGTEGDVTLSGRRMGILSGDDYLQWGKQLNYDQIGLDEDVYSGSQVKPSVPDAGLFLSRDTGEKIWMNSGSITMAAYGFNIICSGSLSGGDVSNPQWDVDVADSGTISIVDNNGNSIVLNSDGITINSNVEINYTSEGDITISSQGKVVIDASNQIELNGSSNTIVANGDNITISGVSNFKIDGLVNITYMAGYTTNMGPVIPTTAMVQSIELVTGNLSINDGGLATVKQNTSRNVKTT